MQQTRFDSNNLGPSAREGYNEPGIPEFVALGMGTTKHRSIETALIIAGSMRRIANAAGLTTPFVEMTTKQVKALAVAVQNYVSPRSEEPNPRPYQVLLRSILKYHAGATEDEADKKRLLACWNLIKPAKPKATKIGPDDILTVDELNRLLDAADSMRDRVLIAALLETGGRVTEVLSLNVESLTRHQNGGNGGRPWYKAWFATMKEEGTEHFGYFREAATVTMIDSWLKNYPSGVDVTPRPLIPSLSFASNDERRLNADSVGDLLQAVAEKAGVEQVKHVHAHIFRHTRATMLLREGVPEPMIKKMLGWMPNSPMLGRYAHLVAQDVEAALGLSAKVEGEKAELLVPKREVPAMPAAPFPLNPAVNAKVEELEQRLQDMQRQQKELANILLKQARQQEPGYV